MKITMKKSMAALLAAVMAFGLTGCQSEEGGKSASAGTRDVANDYYIDLTDLGMKLTIYLRLEEDGDFIFSNTLDFEIDKSSGTFQKSEDEYIMVYSSVNGEEKSVSDGLTSSFVVQEDGSLDFTECNIIHYGSATVTTDSADDPDQKLIALVVPEDYEAPDTESAFQTGVYQTKNMTEGGISYRHTVSFFEDNTYLHTICYEQDGQISFVYETGTYKVSTTQLALEPEGGSEGHEGRAESEVVDENNLKLSVFPSAGAQERSTLEFKRVEAAEKAAELSGKGQDKEGAEFDVTAVIYGDGSYEIKAADFTETGVLTLDSVNAYVKQYPDHPETSVRGLNQVTTVPAGTVSYEDGKLKLEGLRVRKSAGLARYECSVTQ